MTARKRSPLRQVQRDDGTPPPTALEFLRELVRDGMTPAHLAVISAFTALGIAVVVAIATAGRHGWPAFAFAALALAWGGGLFWWMLGTGRVQRWIRDGR